MFICTEGLRNTNEKWVKKVNGLWVLLLYIYYWFYNKMLVEMSYWNMGFTIKNDKSEMRQILGDEDNNIYTTSFLFLSPSSLFSPFLSQIYLIYLSSPPPSSKQLSKSN